MAVTVPESVADARAAAVVASLRELTVDLEGLGLDGTPKRRRCTRGGSAPDEVEPAEGEHWLEWWARQVVATNDPGAVVDLPTSNPMVRLVVVVPDLT